MSTSSRRSAWQSITRQRHASRALLGRSVGARVVLSLALSPASGHNLANRLAILRAHRGVNVATKGQGLCERSGFARARRFVHDAANAGLRCAALRCAALHFLLLRADATRWDRRLSVAVVVQDVARAVRVHLRDLPRVVPALAIEVRLDPLARAVLATLAAAAVVAAATVAATRRRRHLLAEQRVAQAAPGHRRDAAADLLADRTAFSVV